MRAWLALPLLLASFAGAGCLGDDSPRGMTALGLFAFAPVVRGDPVPMPVGDCADLEETLEKRALDHARVSLEQSISNVHWGGIAVDFAMEDSDAGDGRAMQASTQSPGSGSAAGAQVTGTNNQEAEADESDVLKTDGEWTYVLSGNVLKVLHSENVGDIAPVASLQFEGGWGGQLLLEPRDPADPADDRLVVMLPGSQPRAMSRVAADSAEPPQWWEMTRVVVLGLADRSDPRIESDTWVEGSLVTARLVDGVAYVVIHSYASQLPLQTWSWPDESDLAQAGLTWEMYYQLPVDTQRALQEKVAREADVENQRILAEATLEDHLPDVYREKYGIIFPEPTSEEVCDRVLGVPDSTGRGFTTILALGVAEEALPSQTTQVLGAHPQVYANGASLVLAAPSQDAWWFWAQPQLEEATDLQWFDLDGLDVRHKASGRVPGTVLDSFSLDVRGDELRVATTTGTWGRWWEEDPEPMLSHVATFSALAGVLVPGGIVGGIAPGERIWSARFTDDRAYIVTFRQMDPLWVIDLSGEVPDILGELEIPGVSTYIHPVDDDTLLTVGYPGGEGGQGLDTSRVQLSLFDISDPGRPRQADTLLLGGDEDADGEGRRYSHSAAVHEHKAFTYWSALGVVAIPVTMQGGYSTSADGTYWEPKYEAGLELVNVDLVARQLTSRGTVSQEGISQPGWNEVQRSYFLGYPPAGPVSVYSLSQTGIASHDFWSLQPQDSVAFEEQQQVYWID